MFELNVYHIKKLSESYLQFVSLFAQADPASYAPTWKGPDRVIPEIHKYCVQTDQYTPALSWRMHDVVYASKAEDRIAIVYRYCGISKQFIDACVWLWVLYEGRELYLQRNGHYPVDMTEFAWLAFNNDWDDLQPLLEMEI